MLCLSFGLGKGCYQLKVWFIHLVTGFAHLDKGIAGTKGAGCSNVRRPGRSAPCRDGWSVLITGPIGGPERRVGAVGLDAPAGRPGWMPRLDAPVWGWGAGAGAGGEGRGRGKRNTRCGFGKPLATPVHKVIS